MTPEILSMLVVLAVVVILMITELLRADLVALLLAVALALGGVVSVEEAFSGFSGSAVITILGVFILTTGLSRTGVTRSVGLGLYRLAGDHPRRLMLFLMLTGAGLSLVMNNIAAAAVLLPATMDICRRTRIRPSKLLIPLAYGVIMGGMATLLTTSNIVTSTALREQGLAPYGLLEFAPVGLPMIAVGTLYMLLFGHRLLPAVSPTEKIERTERLRQELARTYELEERLSEVLIPANSPLVGKSIAAAKIGERLGLSILAVCRDDRPGCVAPGPDQVLNAGDTLLVTGRPERVHQLVDRGAEVISSPSLDEVPSLNQITMLEVLLSPRSQAAGRTLKNLHFREKYGLNVVAIWRSGRPYRTDVGDIELQFGDALLVHGPRRGFSVLRSDPDFLVLAEPPVSPRTRKGWLAAGIMILTLIVTAANLLPISVAMMLGALTMVVTGCLTMDEAYRGVEWRAIFLIAGMLPIGIALNRSGTAQWLGQLLVGALAGWGPLALAGGIFALAMLLAQVMSGQVAAVVMAPIAIAAAQQVGTDPRTIALASALGSSMAFLTPTGHPVNIFVMNPGGYSFRDYLRVGAPLVVLLFLTLLVVLPLFWPL